MPEYMSKNGSSRSSRFDSEQGFVVTACVGEPVLGAPGAQVSSRIPEHAVELGRKFASRAGAHHVKKIVVVCFNELGCSVGALQANGAAVPESVPPVFRFRLKCGVTFGPSRVELLQRFRRHIRRPDRSCLHSRSES